MGERWAAVEIMGHRQHVGRISEESFAGVTLLRVEALQSDGSFEVVRYGGTAIFSMRDITEEKARHAACPTSWRACSAFTEPSARPGHCSECGHTAELHQPAQALPPHEDDEDEESPDGDDDAPWEHMPGIGLP